MPAERPPRTKKRSDVPFPNPPGAGSGRVFHWYAGKFRFEYRVLKRPRRFTQTSRPTPPRWLESCCNPAVMTRSAAFATDRRSSSRVVTASRAPQLDDAPLSRRLGIAISVGLHLLLALGLLVKWPSRTLELPPAADQKSIEVSLITAAASSPSAAAAPPPAAPPQAVEAPKPKPKSVKPKPKPVVAAQAPAPVKAPVPEPEISKPAEPAMAQSQPAPAATATASSAPSTAAVASATPSNPGAGRPVGAPAVSMSPEQISRLERQYSMMVMRSVERNMRVPVRARQFKETGVTVVRMRIGRDGSVLEARVVTSSGFGYLDEEAQALMFRIASFPPVPPVLRPWMESIVIDQPVNFRL